jgi:hypothetical protein
LVGLGRKKNMAEKEKINTKIEEPKSLERVFVERRRAYAWFVFTGLAVYAQTLFFDFTDLDDDILVLRNFHFISHISNLLKAFQTDVFVGGSSNIYYRPVMTLSFMMDALFGTPAPLIFHLSNVLMHLLACCLVYLFFIKLGGSKMTAFLFTSLFTVHPVLSQAIAWIPGRNELLLVLFLLPAFIFFLDFMRTRRRISLFCHLLFFAFALFTKETALPFILICPLYVKLVLRERILAVRNLIIPAGWFLLLLLWFLLRKTAIAPPLEYTPVYMIRSILSNALGTFLYIGKIIFPINLSVLPILRDSNVLYGIAATALVITLLVISKGKRLGRVIFGTLWFLLFLLPAFIVPNPNHVRDFSEHRAYLPLLGFMIVLMEIDFLRNADFKKRSAFLAGAGVILLFSLINIIHGRDFKDRLSFWLNAIENSPHYTLAHNNLGSVYLSLGNLDAAEKEFLEYQRLGGLSPIAHNNLGVIYLRRGLLKEAENEFKKARESPFYSDPLMNLANLYYDHDQPQEAERLWRRVLEIDPNRANAYSHLAVYYYNLEDLPKAAYYMAEFRKRGGRVDPGFLRVLQPYLAVK